MLMMMSDDNKKSLAEGIMEKFVNGKKVESKKEGEYSESCILAATELLEAIESKNPKRVLDAFVALAHETSSEG